MYAVEKLGSYISTVSGPFHPFGGAVDIIVVEQQDGSFKTSPWYVRFGKFQGVLKMREKEVKISVNGVQAGFSMYLDGRGEAFFLRADDSDNGGSVVSPPSSGDEMDSKLENDQFENIRNPAAEGDVSVKSEAVVTRTNSRRSAIFGFMFGGKPVKGEQDSVDRRNSIERAEIAADLLEMKWSTNLSSRDRLRQKRSSESCEQNVALADKEPSSEKTLTVDDYNSAEVDDESFTSSLSRNYLEQLKDEDTLLVTVKEEVTVLHTSDAGNLADSTSLASDKASKDSVVDYENFNLNHNVSFDDSSVSHDEKHNGSNWNGTVGETFLEEVSSHNEIVEIYSGDKTCSSDIGIIAVETRGVDILHAGSDIYSGNKTEFASEKIDGSISKDSTSDDEGEEIKSVVHSQRIESLSINLHVSSVDSSVGVGIPSSRPQCCNTISEDPSNDSLDYFSNLRTQEFTADNSFVSQRPQCSNLKSLLHSTATIVTEEVGSAVTSEQTLISLPCSPDQQLCSESEICCVNRASIEFSQQNEATVEQLDYSRNQPEIEEKATMIDISFPASLSSAPFSETLDEIQFSFSDCDSFSGKEVELSNDDKLIEEEDLMLTPSSGTKVDDLNFQNCVQPLEDISDVMQPRSNPVNIPGNGLIPSTLELSARSLPVLRTDIDDIEGLNLHYPLSCSLDAKSDTSELDVRKKDKSISSYSLVESGNNFVRTQITPDASDESMENEKKITVNANVELSLCKHLLYKGMGADAARQAFDAEKVNLEKFRTLGPSLVKNNKLVVKLGGYYFPWDAAAPFILGMVSFGQEHIFEPQGMIPVEGDEQYRKDNVINTSTASGGSWSLWPFSLKRSRSTSTKEISTENANDKVVDSSSSTKNSTVEIVSKKVKMVRSLTPTSKELASLNLKEGQNIVTFSFLTPMLGLQKVDARIYLWKWNTRIVISDVDGTITKSDVLGQFMPLVGVDWSQSGVAHLFCAIKENGYQLLFLSARAISQAHLTRQFLFNLKQDGKALPDGPVVISPDGLVPSLYREVIRRAPHEFKISCLEAIKALFPPDSNPFYAGFGNRDTDEISYLKVGIPLGKIFIINPKGQVAVNRQVDTRSYTSLHELVNGMFPPTTSEQEDYNSWNYWKMPPLEIDL